MPELPEIEHLKRSLEPVLTGATVRAVRLHRADVLRRGATRLRQGQRPGRALLAGASIQRLERRGKQLAIEATDGRVVCVHLGMSGALRYLPRGRRVDDARHVHCVWSIASNGSSGRLIFRDPRRFGGLWTFARRDDLVSDRWSTLGPDAATISSVALAARLGRTRRAVKATLLDQSLIAGVGNIYADEGLFRARVHPLAAACSLHRNQVNDLARAVRHVLRRAIDAGGSTVRNYVDGNGRAGRYARRHQVYGRAGLPCVRCGSILEKLVVAQRTTVLCPRCQPR